MRAAVVVAFGLVPLAGCGVSPPPQPNCALTETLRVSPSTATVNHAAAAPGNQQKFTALLYPTGPPGCPIPAYVEVATPTWTNPDPLDVQISSAADATNGLAICKGKTTGPVALTATSTVAKARQSVTVQLTCQ